MQQHLAPRDDVRVVAGDVRVEGEPAGAGDLQAGRGELLARGRGVEVGGVVQGQLEQVEAGPAGLGDGALDRGG